MSTSGASTVDAPARRGRPRSPEVDDAVLTAAIELAEEVGVAGMSMDELARRAGVSKTTIYRRWESKETLVIDAMRSVIVPFDDVDTGTLRGDLETYLGELAARLADDSKPDILPQLLEAGARDATVRASLDDYVRTRRRPLLAIFERAVERGEVGADRDLDVLVDAVIGPFVYRKLLTHDTIDQQLVQRLLDTILPF